MRQVSLPDGKSMSALGFGCAALMGRASRGESEIAVKAALDAGITFFDTARSYGYGRSEELLGELLQGERHRLTLCTKFGILPAERTWKSRLLPAARAAVTLFPALRKAAQKQAGTQFTANQFTVASLTASLETSLRKLRTDYVDILLMHDAPASVLAQDDLLEALSTLVQSGKAKMAGISAALPVISQYLTSRPSILTTAQFAFNTSSIAFTGETQRHANLLLVANHPFGGPDGVRATKSAIEAMASSEALPQDLCSRLRDAAGDPQMLPELLFHLLLDATGVSAVVPAMLQPAHIRSNVRAISVCRFSSEELSLMRRALASTA